MESQIVNSESMETDDVNHLFSKLSDICKQLEQKGEKVLVLTTASQNGSQHGKEFIPGTKDMLSKFQQFCEDHGKNKSSPDSKTMSKEMAEDCAKTDKGQRNSVLPHDTVDIHKHTDQAFENKVDNNDVYMDIDQDVDDYSVSCNLSPGFDEMDELDQVAVEMSESTQRRSTRIRKRKEVEVENKADKPKQKELQTLSTDLQTNKTKKRLTSISNLEDHDRKVHTKVALSIFSEKLSLKYEKDKEKNGDHENNKLVNDSTGHVNDEYESDSSEHEGENSSQKLIKCYKCGIRFTLDQHLQIHLRKIPNCATEVKGSEFNENLNPDLLNIVYKNTKNEEVTVTLTGVLNAENKIPFKCIVCNVEFSKRSNFKRHLVKHSDYVMPGCYICGVTLKSRECHLRHLKEHNQKPYQCEKCDKHRFETMEALANHMKKCSKCIEKDLTCVTCGHKSKCRAALKIHMNVHLGVKLHSCDICGKKMASSSSLERHIMVMHQEETPFKCEHCDKAFKVKDSYKKHLKHHEEPKHKCEICGKTCVEYGNLKKHMMSHTKEKPFVCEVCGNSYSRRSLLDNHMRLHTGEKPYKCSEKDCGKTFRSYSNLKQHIRNHSDSQPYICDVCGKAFKQPGRMSHHRKSHFIEYRWPCNYCSKKFKTLFVYKGHLAKEHPQMKSDIELKANIKLYQCEICQKVYGDKEDLTRHIYIHKGLKPFECKYCAKAFNDKSNLKQHTKIHMNLCKFVCDICNKSFVMKKVLRSHIRNTHGQKYDYQSNEKDSNLKYRMSNVNDPCVLPINITSKVEDDIPVTYHVDKQFNVTKETHVIVEKEPSGNELIVISQQHKSDELMISTNEIKHPDHLNSENHDNPFQTFRL